MLRCTRCVYFYMAEADHVLEAALTGLGGNRNHRIDIHVTIRFTALEYLQNAGSTNGDCEALTKDRHKTQIGKLCYNYKAFTMQDKSHYGKGLRDVQGQPLLKHE